MTDESGQQDLFSASPDKESKLSLDLELKAQGFARIVGVDEAGRGPLAGPVSAAAAFLTENAVLPGLDDSKKLKEPQREHLFELLNKQRGETLFFGHGFASAAEIDELGILPANFLAMKRALKDLHLPDDEHLRNYVLIIDGRDRIPDLGDIQQMPVVRADSRSRAVAAASVVAKVRRDRKMNEYSKAFPHYGFASHKGYGTKVHLQALSTYGPCPIHRKSFEPIRSKLDWPKKS